MVWLVLPYAGYVAADAQLPLIKGGLLALGIASLIYLAAMGVRTQKKGRNTCPATTE
jgi:threonine/homoserine/homoserine lactone efflux protein